VRPFLFNRAFLYDPIVHLWHLANSRIVRTSEPALMAILNTTPDSFSDGGKHNSVESALHAASGFLEHDVAMIDIGGESTRPGAASVEPAEQIRRTAPIISALRARREFDTVAISIDTTRAEVAEAALDAGADAINDVSGLSDDRDAMLSLLQRTGAGYVLMHRLRVPSEDQYSDKYAEAPDYANVVIAVETFFRESLGVLNDAGIASVRVLLDPGLGFGKSVAQNMALLTGTSHFGQIDRPILSALSRKSFVGRVSLNRDSDPSERLEGTIALTALHLATGARVFRVHDVAPLARAIHAAWAAEKSARGWM
jgi:dihydropteroate synthase